MVHNIDVCDYSWKRKIVKIFVLILFLILPRIIFDFNINLEQDLLKSLKLNMYIVIYQECPPFFLNNAATQSQMFGTFKYTLR